MQGEGCAVYNPDAAEQAVPRSPDHSVLCAVVTADSILLLREPDAAWLFMADAPRLRPLSSAHTWLLWDEVTATILARAP